MDFSKHLDKANEASRRKNHALAIGLYMQILDVKPDLADARAGLRKAVDRKFRGKKGGGMLAQIQGLLSLLSATIAKLSKNHATRARSLERYLCLVPDSASVQMALGQTLDRGAWPASAYVVYRHFGEKIRAEGSTANNVDRGAQALLNAGLLAQGLGRLSDAQDCFEAALELKPRDQDALRARKNLAAEDALEEGGFAKATSSRELIRDVEGQREIEKSQRLHRSDEELKDELASLEKKFAVAPDDRVLMKKLGEARAKAGDIAAALDCLERLLVFEPGDFALMQHVGDLKVRDVEEQLAKARKLEDDEEMAILEARLARLRLVEAERSVNAHPTDLGLRHAYGDLLFELGEHDRAIAEFQRSVKDPRHKLNALRSLGRAFKAKNMLDLARSQFEKALDLAGPNHAGYKDLCYDLGCLAQENGDGDGAKGHFNRILELDISYKDVAEKLNKLGV